jgi:hypothetical protein
VKPGALACLQLAVQTLRDDPVGVLLPAGGALLLDALVLRWAQQLWPLAQVQLDQALLLLLLALGIREILRALLRSRMLAASARASGLPAAPWGRPLALLGVQLVVVPLTLGFGALLAVPIAMSALFVGSHGWFTSSALLLALSFAAALLASVLVRALFAAAPSEVIVARRSALRALLSSARCPPQELAVRLLLVLAGDLLVSVGGLSCGAGGLPGYPITDVAMLHRWRGRERGSV